MFAFDVQELITVCLMCRWDPDMLVGYEIQQLSWGYLIERASHLKLDLCSKLSRIPSKICIAKFRFI